MKQTRYDVEYRVFLFHVSGLTEEGRHIIVPWLGPYRVTERLSDVGYIVESELGRKIARVHVNRLRKVPERRDIYAAQWEQGLCPDVRRVLRGVLDHRTVGWKPQ